MRLERYKTRAEPNGRRDGIKTRIRNFAVTKYTVGTETRFRRVVKIEFTKSTYTGAYMTFSREQVNFKILVVD